MLLRYVESFRRGLDRDVDGDVHPLDDNFESMLAACASSTSSSSSSDSISNKPQLTFLDVGSGVGKAPIVASLL